MRMRNPAWRLLSLSAETNMNPFQELKQIATAHNLSMEELIHILMASVYLECCNDCVDQLHSPEFLKAVENLAGQLKLCKAIAGREAA
jgi:hypothetical protein